MQRLSRVIDNVNVVTGRTVAWCILLMVLVQLTVVSMRYVYSATTLWFIPSVWLQEAVVYFHGATIMLGAGYAFLYDGHVRVDVLRGRASQRSRDWTDLIGSLLLLIPLCAIIAWSAYPNVLIAWVTLEGSLETNGLPFRYVLKTMVLAFAVLLGLQAASVALKAVLRLRGQDLQVFEDVTGK